MRNVYIWARGGDGARAIVESDSMFEITDNQFSSNSQAWNDIQLISNHVTAISHTAEWGWLSRKHFAIHWNCHVIKSTNKRQQIRIINFLCKFIGKISSEKRRDFTLCMSFLGATWMNVVQINLEFMSCCFFFLRSKRWTFNVGSRCTLINLLYHTAHFFLLLSSEGVDYLWRVKVNLQLDTQQYTSPFVVPKKPFFLSPHVMKFKFVNFSFLLLPPFTASATC